MATTSVETRSTKQTIGPDEAIRLAQRKQLPSHTEPGGPGIRQLTGIYATLAGQALHLARVSALSAYRRACNGAVRGYSGAVQKGQSALTRTSEGAGDQKRDHPVRTLAVIAGSAFLTGAASRIWRSRSI